MTQASYSLRLQSWPNRDTKRLTKKEGMTLNQFINTAVAGKISVLRTADWFRERAKKGNVKRALQLLERMGSDEPPRAGDEIEPVARPAVKRKRA